MPNPVQVQVPRGELDPERDQLLARGCVLGLRAAFEAIGAPLTGEQRQTAFQLLGEIARGERTFAAAPDDQPDPAQWPAAVRFIDSQRDDAARILRFIAWARGDSASSS